MNNKIIVLAILIGMIIIGSASNGERMGNPHVDDNVTVYVYPEVDVYPEITVQHNSTMETPNINVTVELESNKPEYNPNDLVPVIIQGETIVTKQLLEEFMHNQGFTLFFEYKDPKNPNEIIYMDQCWTRTQSTGFVRVKLLECVPLEELKVDIFTIRGNFDVTV